MLSKRTSEQLQDAGSIEITALKNPRVWGGNPGYFQETIYGVEMTGLYQIQPSGLSI